MERDSPITLRERISRNETFLMEGALGERLKREYHLDASDEVAMASLVYQKAGRNALRTLWLQYLTLANEYNLPFLATTPIRRANRERVKNGAYSESIIRDNVIFIRNVLSEIDHLSYIGGLMGCKGDAYTGKGNLPEEEAYELQLASQVVRESRNRFSASTAMRERKAANTAIIVRPVSIKTNRLAGSDRSRHPTDHASFTHQNRVGRAFRKDAQSATGRYGAATCRGSRIRSCNEPVYKNSQLLLPQKQIHMADRSPQSGHPASIKQQYKQQQEKQGR